MKKFLIIVLFIVCLLSFVACGGGNTDMDDEAIYKISQAFVYYGKPTDATLNNCSVVNDGNSKVIANMTAMTSNAYWTVNVPAENKYSFSVKYKCDPNTRYALFVNDNSEYDLRFGGDNSYKISTIIIDLKKGVNTLKIRNTQGQGYEACIEYILVRGFGSASDVADCLGDISITEGDVKIAFPKIYGFEFTIIESGNKNVIGTDGTVKMLSYLQATPKNISVKVRISHKNDSDEKSINVFTPVIYPSAEQIADEIFSEENNKIIQAGVTALPKINSYYGHVVNIIYSSDQNIVNGNRTVNAKKDDSNVKIVYRITKPDGATADTEKINYIVKGTGYETETFVNPLGIGQDPYINYIDGWYYHIQSRHGGANARLEMVRSKSFIEFTDDGFKTIFTFEPYQTNKWNCSQVWGPFPLMKWNDGRYYIYYSASNGNNDNHRQGVLKSKTDDPMGEYEDLGIINTSDNENSNPTVNNTVWAIGATTFINGDNSYLVWSGWKNNHDQFPQRSYIAKIIDPKNVGARVEIASPTYDWEGVKEGTPLMEGQTIYKINDKIFMLYSANASWAGRYRLGIVEFIGDDNSQLTDAELWVKRENPVFESTCSVESPGGPTLVPTSDNREWWLLYHSSRYFGSGWDRCVSAKPIRFGEDGLPVFDDPIPFYTPIRKPSGDDYIQNKIYIQQAEDRALDGGLKIGYSENCVNGAFVYGMDSTGDKIAFSFDCRQSGYYKIVFRYSVDGDGVQHLLKVNGQVKPFPRYEYYGFDIFFTIETGCVLKEGKNDIVLEYLAGGKARIDFGGIYYFGE